MNIFQFMQDNPFLTFFIVVIIGDVIVKVSSMICNRNQVESNTEENEE